MNKIIQVILILIVTAIAIPTALFLLKFLLLLIADGIIYVGLILVIAFVFIVISNIIKK